ncbi:hypothetical protein SY27_17935 [Flavobacterium sp. 316]|uniref:hypothetical protein n=1 Tax=Flavobacterium sp. 316 TaxID=1603293 RepID=UPI0005E81742|nr:hypothetical protein [Flavobacterium sp. 316]KIX19690.1 hypothetical protein SY27_17935 [Flavobacterium sp. 316]
MKNNELIILLSLAKSTLKDKQEGLITSEEANKVFLQIKQKLQELDDDVSKGIMDKLISRIEF